MTSNLELALLISASTRGFDAFNKAQSEIGGIKGAVEGAKAAVSAIKAELIALGTAAVAALAKDGVAAATEYEAAIVRASIAMRDAGVDADTIKTALTELNNEAASGIFTQQQLASAFAGIAAGGLGLQGGLGGIR